MTTPSIQIRLHPSQAGKGLGTYANGEGAPIPERSLEVGRRCEFRHIADFRTEEHIIGDMPQTTRRTDAPNRRASMLSGSLVQINARMRYREGPGSRSSSGSRRAARSP